jgi:hypothetical protein
MNDAYRDGARVEELRNELNSHRAVIEELSHRVYPPEPPNKKYRLIDRRSSDDRDKPSATWAALAGLGVGGFVGGVSRSVVAGCGFAYATFLAVSVLVNFVIWPILHGNEIEPVERSPQWYADQIAIDNERAACEALERQIAEVQLVLPDRTDQRS